MRRRRGTLTEEDARLWAGIAETVAPLKGRLRRRAAAPPVLEEPSPVLPAGLAKAVEDALPAPSPAPAVRPRRLTQHPIEKPVLRKLGKGRLPIQARIDLHEMTQAVAHYALAGFLRQAQAAGLRHVLVITGRGNATGSRGVLRRTVPHWFTTPEFRPLVSGYEPAERQHGGDGALYVRVRRLG
ncbi:Smr/MutS family protein [Mangrovibrevibacter kandeliae]|uniref:Smr/MutS family protein n=1 Tax=Mangrovibrevibacter kandeliae TaxID=2968473 RepID=UPI002117F50A|nr:MULTISPECIES: Smr/MutS family protein [unclassified Aurantimonas]MCQ8782329.1 Smr/MutS family protein [Aurantimonas sp. CSK15Z-1]MCW4115024.1 Smr/MutS family protein [Aurantimonas sp. MSK8Z-1]